MDKAYKPPAILRARDIASVRGSLTVGQRTMLSGGIDLRKVMFMDPAALVLLYHFANRPGVHKVVDVVPPLHEPAKVYFDLHYSHAVSKNPLKPKSLRSYPLRFIASENNVGNELATWRTQIMKTGALGEETARNLSRTLSEVLTNSFSHGRTRDAIIAGQTFQQKRHTVIAAADFGETIPQTLSRAVKEMVALRWSDEDWIKHSLGKGITCGTRPANKGLGLFLLKEQVVRARGTLLIVSGSGILMVDREGEVTAQPLGRRYDRFPGTFLLVDLPVQ